MANDSNSGSLSGLTSNEAKEFHRIFMGGFAAFFALSFFAHSLIWMWRPWF